MQESLVTAPLFPDVASPVAYPKRSRVRDPGRLSGTLYTIFGAVAVGASLTPNPLLSAASIVVLAVLIRLLRRPGETPVLLFAVGMQWAQVSAKLFEADYQGVTVNELGRTTSMATAIWLGLAGVTVLAIGMHVAVRKLKTPVTKIVDQGLRSVSIVRLFVLHVSTLAAAIAAERLVWVFLPLGEILHAVADIRWAFYFLLGFATLRLRRKPVWFLISTGLEFVLGIGYFSTFKTVLFMAVIAAIASGRRWNFRTATVVAVAGGATIFLGLAWQTVKDQYRAYLNQGTHQQVVLVSPEDQVQTFTQMVGGVDSRQLTGSVQSLLERLAYVDFFADVLNHVPAEIPHEHGALLWKTILHILRPRLFFPDKEILGSDSDETMHYTGRVLAAGAQGTSFSLGYMVEQYIDFGVAGMFLPIFLIGLAWGGIYRYCLTRPQPWAFRFAFATALMIFVYEFEMAEIKLMGGTLVRLILFALFMRFAMPSISPWLTQKRKAA